MIQKSKEKSLLHVAIYIRVSTDAQALKGDSLSEQKATCQNYIDSHDNMILYDIYVDDGVSGQKLNRGDFTRLMEDVKAGKIDLIVFTKLDRWFRSLRHYLNTQEILDAHKVNWIAVSQAFFDTTTPQGRAFIAQSMTFAELEAQNASQRILSVFDYKYKKGEVISGKAPWGYSIVDKHLVPNEDAPKVLATFQYFDRTNSLHGTVMYLEKEFGRVTCQRNLKQYILTNKKYIGIFRDNENYCPPIVPKELFESVQKRMQHNVKSSQKHEYVFSSLIVCDCCGHRYKGEQIGSRGRYYPYYRCTQAHPTKRCINKKSTSENVLERDLVANIKNHVRQHLTECETKNAPILDNRQKKANLLNKIDKLKELFVNDLITLEEFKADKAAYLEQLAAIPDIIKPVKDLTPLREFLEIDLQNIYWDLDKKDRRYLWRSIIKEIRIDENKKYDIIFL